jgi:hypothetical protein
MRRKLGFGRLSVLVPLRCLDDRPGHDYTSNWLHADTDAICPRCLAWIAAEDIVRRTAYGLLQHEACDVPAQPQVVSTLHG